MKTAAFLLILAARQAFASPLLEADALLRDHLWRELAAAPAEARPKVGLVLSAGSLRAASHVGVISVLENKGFPIDIVAGTSMGAVIGSMYAGGTSVKTLMDISRTFTFSSGTNYDASHLVSLLLFDSLLSSARTEQFLTRHIKARRFDELPKPFACVAMDLYSGEAIIFREGDLAPAVRASMSLPGLFSAVEYRHRYLVDGGVVDYIPTDAARLLGAEWVIASVTETDFTHAKPQSVLQTLEQVIDIRGALVSREQRKKANYLIEPSVGDIGMYDYQRVQEAIDKGVIAASRKAQGAMDDLLLFALPRLASRWQAPK